MKNILPQPLRNALGFSLFSFGVAALSLELGCAAFSTTQVQLQRANGGKVVTTTARALTFFDSKSELSKFKALQTDKTQSASVGALSQEASGTNAVQFLEALAKLAAAVPK